MFSPKGVGISFLGPDGPCGQNGFCRRSGQGFPAVGSRFFSASDLRNPMNLPTPPPGSSSILLIMLPNPCGPPGPSGPSQLPRKGPLQQRLLQRLQRRQLPLVDNGQPPGFGGEELHSPHDFLPPLRSAGSIGSLTTPPQTPAATATSSTPPTPPASARRSRPGVGFLPEVTQRS